MYQESVLSYRNFRYLKFGLFLTAGAVVAYLLDPAAGPHNGGTWVGYGLGCIATLLLLWLMWLGIRKRRYRSRMGTLQGWVSAHVYLGITLVFVATLHAGFQFGFNVHTLSYVLLLLVVISGLYGVFAYLRYPPKMGAARGGMTNEQILQEITELDQECLLLADGLSPEIQRTLVQTIENTRFGESLWRQLWNKNLRPPSTPARKPAGLEEYEAYDDTMFTIADHMTRLNEDSAVEPLRRILELLGRRNALCKRLQSGLHYHELSSVWQYFHIPFSFALLAALIVHVVTVFLYW